MYSTTETQGSGESDPAAEEIDEVGAECLDDPSEFYIESPD